MLSRSTLLHLRIPFSFFLMPVFCFATAVSQGEEIWRVALVFFILHLLVYPASNGFNSFYDKDEESIGGLESPPPVSKELLWTSLIIDALALLLALFLGLRFTLAVFLYGLASKAYSYDKIRLKKYPITSWLVIGFFQGAFTFFMVYEGLGSNLFSDIDQAKVWQGALLSTWMLMGSYPMTQVYQHKEDSRRGDLTLSLLLGIRGTFVFTLLVFGTAGAAYFLYFWHNFSWMLGLIFEISLFPVVSYFLFWFYRVWKDEQAANFRSTMRLNLISALCLNIFFIGWALST